MAKILIVDDAPTDRILLNVFFKQLGHTVVGEAKNGFEAVEMFEQYKPDIVTMDIMMPLADGFTASKQIKNKYPDAIIVMITNINSRNDVMKAIQYGAKSYIIKPILKNKLEKLLVDLSNEFLCSKD